MTTMTTELPEFVKFVVKAKGRIYWAVPDVYHRGCNDCAFNSDSATTCNRIAMANGFNTGFPCNHVVLKEDRDHPSIPHTVFLHPRFVKSYTLKYVTARLEGTA